MVGGGVERDWRITYLLAIKCALLFHFPISLAQMDV